MPSMQSNTFPNQFSFPKGKKPQKHIKLPGIECEDSSQGNPVTSLQWDPFSSNFILVCTTNGKLLLVDASADTPTVITSYHLPSKAVTIKCVTWLTEAPGAFVTGGINMHSITFN